MIGITVSHYKILDKLGAGGMGEVFLALDTELERKVALKFLPPHVGSAPDVLERFKREAKATAALQHPNIVTIHEIGEHEGRHYIVMAYIEGDLLSELIARKDMPVERALDITLALCDALGEAHRAGIVHRDLKPDNILIDLNGRPQVLDFGLAMSAGATKLTQEGTTVGTLHYMSPEQSRGGDVDERTDIFSLGAILYEMITSQHAFPGDHAAAIHYQIANEDPQPLSRFNKQATPELERIVMKSLAKDCQVRYQTMSGLAAAVKPLRGGSQISSTVSTVHPLRSGGRAKYLVGALAVVAVLALGYQFVAPRLGGEASSENAAIGKIRTLAVLPFKDPSGDAEQAYFAEGMTGALIQELGKVSALKVISTHSMMKYRDTDKPLSVIAGELGADAFVQGSVQQADGKVRINVELILADTNERLWGDYYDSEFGDILMLQSEVALAITGQIKVNLAPFEDDRLRQARSVHPDALRACLKGAYYRSLISVEGLEKARESYERAIALDPTFALPYVGLADVHLWMAHVYGDDQQAANLKKVVAYAQRALEIDRSEEEAHALLAAVHVFAWDWAGADVALQKAREINANSPAVRDGYSSLLLLKGELDDGVSEHVSAIALNPLSHPLACSMPRKYYIARQFASAVEYGRHAAERFPFCPFERLAVGKALLRLGDYDEAITEFEASLDVEDTQDAVAGLACAHELAGRHDEAQRALERILANKEHEPYFAAVVYTAMEDPDRAFAALEEAYQQHSTSLPWLGTDPAFDALRSDPRFANLVERIGLPSS